MKPESKQSPAEPVLPRQPSSMDAGLQALLARLDVLSRQPLFQVQRERAIGQALRLYTDDSGQFRWIPLIEEMDLALLYVFTDYFPDDGQPSLIEQVRDTIEVHVPEEERHWLDPLKHSSMDLLEVRHIDETDDDGLFLRSLGDGTEFRVCRHTLGRPVQKGQVLLTRLIHQSDRTILPGTAIVLASKRGQDVLSATHQWQREMEAESGSFALGEWREFVKRFGYVLLWSFARVRLDAILAADAAIQYRTLDGQPFLDARALYEHAAFRRLAEGMPTIDRVQAVEGKNALDARIWVQRESVQTGPHARIVARVTLMPTQLMVECDSADRLNNLKHQLASEFGFTLHFRGETTAVPIHDVPTVDFEEEGTPITTVVVTQEEEYRLLKTLLESMYLEWADRSSPALDNLTPRHAAAMPAYRERVVALIDQMERDDPAFHRTGARGYDYNVLRAHVGVPEATV